jgi:hypothetical protein
MGEVKKLIDIIPMPNSLDKEDTIYAKKPWTVNSIAMVIREPDSGELPTEARSLDMEYFLEVFLALEFLEGWELNQISHQLFDYFLNKGQR